MATTVYEVKEYILDDGSVITCKPANIKVMRKGTEMLKHLGDPLEEEGEELSDEEKEQKALNRLMDIVCLCLKGQRPDFETENDEGKKTTNYDLLEELFDSETMFKVIEMYLGVKLNDPKMMEAALKEMLRQEELEQAGTS